MLAFLSRLHIASMLLCVCVHLSKYLQRTGSWRGEGSRPTQDGRIPFHFVVLKRRMLFAGFPSDTGHTTKQQNALSPLTGHTRKMDRVTYYLNVILT